MGSLCPTKSMQVSSHVVCSQLDKEFAVELGCYHFLYDPGPELPLSVLQLKENFNSECQCHRIYHPWLFRSLLYNSGCSHCMYAPWMYDPWLFRLSPLQLQKKLAVHEGCCHIGRIQTMGFLSVCSSTEICGFKSHCMYDAWSSACLLCNSKEYLQCKQVIVTACTTRGFRFAVLQLKANSVQR